MSILRSISKRVLSRVDPGQNRKSGNEKGIDAPNPTGEIGFSKPFPARKCSNVKSNYYPGESSGSTAETKSDFIFCTRSSGSQPILLASPCKFDFRLRYNKLIYRYKPTGQPG
jgi:hypothetical protein